MRSPSSRPQLGGTSETPHAGRLGKTAVGLCISLFTYAEGIVCPFASAFDGTLNRLRRHLEART